MKLLIIAITAFSMNAFAGESCTQSATEETVLDKKEITTDVPKYLEGATITVRLKDGKETTVPAEKFKVVPRKQQYLVTRTSVYAEEVCHVTDNHRVSLHAGRGAKGGLDRDNSNAPNSVNVESQFGAVGGLQYQYRFDDSNWSLSGQGLTSRTGLVGIGYDF